MSINSQRAVEMSIYVVRAFVQLRELLASNKELAQRLDELEARIEKKLTRHDGCDCGDALSDPAADESADAERRGMRVHGGLEGGG